MFQRYRKEKDVGDCNTVKYASSLVDKRFEISNLDLLSDIIAFVDYRE